MDSIVKNLQRHEEWGSHRPSELTSDHPLYHQLMYQEIVPNFLTLRETQRIVQELITREDEVMSIPSRETGYENLTGQHQVFNWLSVPSISRLGIPNKLFQLPLYEHWEYMYIQCWGNILRQGQNLPLHCHRGLEDRLHYNWNNTQYAMNVFLSGHTDTGTTIEGTKHDNEIGQLVILGEDVEHKVTTNFYQEPRISLAMDVFNADHIDMEETTERYLKYYNPFI